ncbi:MAG: hypothetical protein K8T26_03070 [Lentisphaerae bacterium]|nr:hypothetical protein [Lentisphaerota bacterium]
MIRLHPIPDVHLACPLCQAPLASRGWYMPGMRCLADLACTACNRTFYGDLPSSHGLFFPMLLDPQNGHVHNPHGAQFAWFADWLATGYAARQQGAPDIAVEARRPLRRPLVLNCLDARYGHALLKLLNAEYHVNHDGDFDLLVLVPKCLRWMVPANVAEVWAIDVPLHNGCAWHDGLAKRLHERLQDQSAAWLSLALPHPPPDAVQIESFTHVPPFDFSTWGVVIGQPRLTLIWREERDRYWTGGAPAGIKQALRSQLGRAVRSRDPRAAQTLAFARLCAVLRERLPGADLAVAGLGRAGDAPDGVADLRAETVDAAREQAWCRRYADSHVVIGVHGSNMLLPSAHAGAVVEMVPPASWRNVMQDILLPEPDARRLALRCRLLPVATAPEGVAEVVVDLVSHLALAAINLSREWSTHEAHRPDPYAILRRRQAVGQGRKTGGGAS